MEQRCKELEEEIGTEMKGIEGGNWNRDVRNWSKKLEQRCKELEEEIGTEM